MRPAYCDQAYCKSAALQQNPVSLASERPLRDENVTIRPALRGIALCALLLVMASCGSEWVRRTAPEAEERFARQYFNVWVDSGVDAALARSMPATRSIPDFSGSLETLRTFLLKHDLRDSLVLQRWTVLAESGTPASTKMTYLVNGAEGRFLVGAWVQHETDRLLVNTVFYGQEPPTGHLPGDR